MRVQRVADTGDAEGGLYQRRQAVDDPVQNGGVCLTAAASFLLTSIPASPHAQSPTDE